MASDMRRWWVHTLTDHLVFSFQANIFIPRNKKGVVRALRFREDQVKETATFLSQAVSCSQGQWWSVSPWNTKTGCLQLSPGGNLQQCPRRSAVFLGARKALSVVSETKALAYTLLARLTTFYLKLKFSNSSVPYQYFSLHTLKLPF